MRNSYSFAVDVENALCGHEEPFRAFSSVYTSGQKRRLTPQISANSNSGPPSNFSRFKEHHRNHLAHTSGDVINAVLAAFDYKLTKVTRAPVPIPVSMIDLEEFNR